MTIQVLVCRSHGLVWHLQDRAVTRPAPRYPQDRGCGSDVRVGSMRLAEPIVRWDDKLMFEPQPSLGRAQLKWTVGLVVARRGWTIEVVS